MLTHFVTDWASPFFQENIVFEFDKKIYFLDRQIAKCMQGIFRFIRDPFQIQKKMTLSRLIVPFITPQQVKLTFGFFHLGKLPDVLEKGAVKLLDEEAELFDLSLLNSYLQTRKEKPSHAPKEKENFLNDQLAIFALQQNIEDFGKAIISLETYQSIQLSVVRYFQPLVFENLMVKWIRPHDSVLYSSMVEEYCQRRWTCLESSLLFFSDQTLKFDCLAKCPLLERRIQWFNIFWKQIPIDLTKQAIIQPLMEMQRLLEAKAWMLKIEDRVSKNLFNDELNKAQRKEIADFFPLLDQLTLYELKSFSSFEDKNKIAINSHLHLKSSRTRLIQNSVDRYFRACMDESLYPSDSLPKTFKEILETQFGEDENIVWDPSLILLVAHSFIQSAVQYTNEKIMKKFKIADVTFQSYEAYLHPAFPTSCEVIEKLKDKLKDIFCREFQNEEGQILVFQDDFELLEALHLTTRQCYTQNFSIQNDFIVQFVSKHWLMNIKGCDTKPLIYELEDAFKTAQFGKLSQAQIELAFSTYLRFATEIDYLHFIFSQQKRLNIYDSNRMHVHEIVSLLENLFPKLLQDFPIEIMEKRASSVAKVLCSSADLKRVLSIHSLQAFYSVKSLEPIERYSPYRSSAPVA